MKLPRDLTGGELARALTRVGYATAILAEVGARLQLDRKALLQRLGL